MTNRLLTFMAILGAVALMAAGCGDDDTSTTAADATTAGDTTTTDTGTGEDTTDTTDTGDDTTDTGDDTTDTGEDLGVDNCLNDADQAVLSAPDADIVGQATTCGLGCIGQPPSCATPCVAEKTGLSEACAACYGAIINCSISNCVGPCAADPGGDDCTTCQVENGCVELLETCSGINVSDDTGDDTTGD